MELMFNKHTLNIKQKLCFIKCLTILKMIYMANKLGLNILVVVKPQTR